MFNHFNGQLFLFALLGMAVAFAIEVARKGWPSVQNLNAAFRYGLVLLVAIALVAWIDTQVVRTILVSLAICGACLIVQNNLTSKK